MMKGRRTVDLPEVLVVDILSRVPAISLARFRSVSKGWNSLIKDESFAKMHSSNAPRSHLSIMLNNFRLSLVNIELLTPSVNLTDQFSLKDPLSSQEVDIHDVFHCDGLLLCITKYDTLVVLNPCSGETRWIPKKPYVDAFRYALGKSSCNKYKILRIHRHSQYDNEVYDLSSNSWRSVDAEDWLIQKCWRHGVFFKGNTYWLATRRSNREQRLLLSFDFSTERFQSHSTTPYSNSLHYVAALSVIREERLCLLISPMYGNAPEIWMASKNESTGDMSWSKFLTAKIDYRVSHGMSFLADEENKVVVCCINTGVPNNTLHILGQDKYIQVDHYGEKSSFSRLLNYVPTLVQIPQVI